MKTSKLALSCAATLSVCLLAGRPARADDVTVVRDVFATWGVLSKNVKITRLSAKRGGGERTLAGEATVFGHSGGVRVSYGGGAISEVAVDFPKSARLTTGQFQQVFGMAPGQMFPGRGGAAVGLKHLMVRVENRRIEAATIVTTLGTWAPMGNGAKGKVVQLTAIESEFGIEGIQGSPRITARIETKLSLPGRLAKNLGIGQTSLTLTGLLKSRPLEIRLGADLASDGIPLDRKKTLVLQQAGVEFFLQGGKPGLALVGKLQLRPAGRPPLTLGGLVSIDVAGTVYAEGYMDKGTAQPNPFGISKSLTLERAGLGFGANFATAIPTPIIAVEGGLKFRDRRGRTKSGFATIGIDTGNPTRNMIDAELQGLNMEDFVDAFAKFPVPREVTTTLRGMALKKLRLTFVPPGPGVKLFGVDYEPGITAEGEFKFGDITGYVYIKVKEDGIEAFGAMTPIRAQGFAITGTRPGTAPMLYLKIDPPPNIPVLVLNGQLEVLAAKAKTDVYFSDAGFSATIEGRITGGHSAKLDVAGVAFHSNPTVYVKASMKNSDSLVGRINELASAEFRKAAKNTNRDFNRVKADLRRQRPQLAKLERELVAKQNQVRADYKRLCKMMDQRKNQQAEKKRKTAAVRKLKGEIRREESQLKREQYKRAKNLRGLACPGGWHKYKGWCWRCPGGFGKEVVQPWDSAKACSKPRKNILKGMKFKRAKKGQNLACRPPLIKDLGRCWQCPTGFKRKVSVFPINGPKGCHIANYDARASRINGKKARLASLEADLALITKGIGKAATELTRAGANVCQKAKSTEAINADPRVAPAFSRWSTLSLKVIEGEKIIAGTQAVVVGGLNVGAWIAKNGGEAARPVQVQEASFEGCASAVEGGHVALKVKGKLMDRPFKGAFNLKLQRPDDAIRAMADTLLANKPLRATVKSGNCRRPNVPRPKLGDRFGAKLAQLDGSKKKLRPRPRNKKAPRPGWAGPRVTRSKAPPPSTMGRVGSGSGGAMGNDDMNDGAMGGGGMNDGMNDGAVGGGGMGDDGMGATSAAPPKMQAMPPPMQTAPRAKPSCREVVRTRVASDYTGGHNWSASELDTLCGNTGSLEPARCISIVMHRGINWGGGTQWMKPNAINLCRRSPSAKRTVGCFQKSVGKVGWQRAIKGCQVR